MTADTVWGGTTPYLDPAAAPPLPAEMVATRPGLVIDWLFQRPEASDLPEIEALISEGWLPVLDAPLWALVPAAWPVTDRLWLVDRRPQFGLFGIDGAHSVLVDAPPDGENDVTRIEVRAAAKIGLPSPPAGRIWVVRSPWPAITTRSLLDQIETDAGIELLRSGIDQVCAMYESARAQFQGRADLAR